MHIVMDLFIGALLCNSVPHLVCGLTGERFPTPFAKPRGVGLSSPLINFIWGALNALIALLLIFKSESSFAQPHNLIPAAIGFLLMGLYLSVHFGKVKQASKRPK